MAKNSDIVLEPVVSWLGATRDRLHQSAGACEWWPPTAVAAFIGHNPGCRNCLALVPINKFNNRVRRRVLIHHGT